jgi:PST family polysaccharide transporter
VWIINFCCHLFGVVDRYMLVHFSGLENESALALVGQYHASRIVPLLFLSLADLLGAAVLPYLSHDWETGARQRVSDRLNTVIKLTSLVMLAGAVAVMWIAPLLFRIAFQGRYDAGLAVMPWTLTYCVWYSLLLVAQNYVWCAEKAKLGVLPLIAGLGLNVATNLVLVPAWGLLGAVVSTTASTGVALAMLYWINRRIGMGLDYGTIALSVAPLALGGGVWCASAVLILLAVLVPFSRTLISQDERDLFAEFGKSYLHRLASYWTSPAEKQGATHAVGS